MTSTQAASNTTQATPCLAHLTSQEVTISFKHENQIVDAKVTVYYSNHCWTRSKGVTDPDSSILHSEQRKNGYVDHRVFDQERYDFSKSLPSIIDNLTDKVCLQGNGSIFYRHERPGTAYTDEGWYICARLEHQQGSLRLSVRSVHYRKNKPVDTRGPAIRFRELVRRLMRQHKMLC